jgi:hypothetical protein
MKSFQSICYYTTVISGLILIIGVFFKLSKKITAWYTYSIILMSICALGYFLFLFFSFKNRDNEKQWELIIAGALIFIAGFISSLFIK